MHDVGIVFAGACRHVQQEMTPACCVQRLLHDDQETAAEAASAVVAQDGSTLVCMVVASFRSLFQKPMF